MVSRYKNIKIAYMGFVWHAFFLALTMSMIDLNTVFPSLVSELTGSKTLFGLLYSIMLGVPLVFNLGFSFYLKTKKSKKKYLLLGIYLRAVSFLGMAVFTYIFGLKNPMLTFASFFIWIIIFSISGGIAGISYSDITAKIIPATKRTNLYIIKQFFSSIAAFVGGISVSRILSNQYLDYPINYSITLFIGFIGLIIASIGFLVLVEPKEKTIALDQFSFSDYIKKVPNIIKSDAVFRRFVIVENMASFSIMILPFYIIFSKEMFKIDNTYIGRYLIYQVVGTVVSTIIWWFIAKKVNSKSILKICILVGGLIPLVAIVLSMFGPDYFAIVFLLIGFIISGRKVGFEPYLLEIVPEDKRTDYLGIRGSLNIFIVVLPILGGFFIEVFGYYFTFCFVSAVMIIASLLLKNNIQ